MMKEELKLPLQQIRSSREYTLSLIDDLQPDEWYKMPAPPISHIAWQVGHIAMAQFRLCLERLRNLQPGDWDLIPKDFLRTFAKGTVPEDNVTSYPPLNEIKSVFHRVHVAVLKQVPEYEGSDLEIPIRNPHPIFKTKKEALLFSAQHEMLHAGQIGMLRRLLGKAPIR